MPLSLFVHHSRSMFVHLLGGGVLDISENAHANATVVVRLFSSRRGSRQHGERDLDGAANCDPDRQVQLVAGSKNEPAIVFSDSASVTASVTAMYLYKR